MKDIIKLFDILEYAVVRKEPDYFLSGKISVLLIPLNTKHGESHFLTH